MVPYENLHKPKSVTELSFWKAADYRLFLFHLGPLLLQQFSLSDSELAEIFCRVSFAIRVLSEQRLNDSIISHAEKQIKICLEKFLKVLSRIAVFPFAHYSTFGRTGKKIGPLWMVSAFSFESAKHMLIRTVKGTLKNPEKIVEKFLSKQSMQDETKNSKLCSLYKTKQ